MTGRAAPTAIDPSAALRCRWGRPREKERSSAPAALDSRAPKRVATRPGAQRRRRPDAEIDDGEVSWRFPSERHCKHHGMRTRLAAEAGDPAKAGQFNIQSTSRPTPLKIGTSACPAGQLDTARLY